MENIDFATLFQGIGTMMASGWVLASARVFSGTARSVTNLFRLERYPRTYGDDPYGTGNGSYQLRNTDYARRHMGNLFLDPMLSDTDQLMNTMQIDFLQPVYTLTFSNGLIACFVFMGIGTLLDVGFLLQKPFCKYIPCSVCRIGALFLTVPIASALGLTLKEKCISGYGRWSRRTDGIVYFTGIGKAFCLCLLRWLPIFILGLTYGGYPYLVKLLVPKRSFY